MKDHLGPRLKHLHFCTDQAITEAASAVDLTASQGLVLSFLAHRDDAPCPKDIEDAFHLSHPTVSGVLARLEKKEFIAIRPDETDRRCKRIYLLPKGDTCHRQIHNIINEIEARLTAGFTPDEKQTLARLLDKAIANVGQPCKHCPKEEHIQ